MVIHKNYVDEASSEYDVTTDLLGQWVIDRDVENRIIGPKDSVVEHVEWLQERVRRLEQMLEEMLWKPKA